MVREGEAERRRQTDVPGLPAAGAPRPRPRAAEQVRRLRLPRLLGGVRGETWRDGGVRRHREARPGGRQGDGQHGCHHAAEVGKQTQVQHILHLNKRVPRFYTGSENERLKFFSSI